MTDYVNYQDSKEGISPFLYAKKAVPAVVLSLMVTNPNVSASESTSLSDLTNPSVSIDFGELSFFQEDEYASFVGFLDEQIELHPELVTPVDEDQLARIKRLVERVVL